MGHGDKQRHTIFRHLALSMAPPEIRPTDIPPGDDGRMESRLAAAIFSSTPQSLVIADADGRIVAANPAFSRLTGYSLDDIRGCDIGVLQSDRQGPEFRQAIGNAIEVQGYWRGEIWSRRKNAVVYPVLLTVHALHDDDGRITHYVATSTDLTCVDWSRSQSQYLLRHDGLTGLPNRLLLYPHLDQAIARAADCGAEAAVLIIGLDRFDTVGDSLGHEAGDEVLTSVSRRLRRRLRDSDLLARLDGAEFAVVLENAGGAAASALAEKLIGALAARFVLSTGQDVYIGASVGVASFPDHGSASHDLVQHAEAALHHAEHAGKGVRLYSADLTRTAHARSTLDAKMRRALERNEFALHYQPICALADRTVVAVEALLRWNDRTFGLVPPSDFIPLAEETGVIAPLTDWVLRTACAQMKTWLADGVSFRRMAVNVSATFFRNGGGVERLGHILKETGLPAECLELELTEGALLEDTADLRDKMTALKALGVGLAIDDFGTGYSSLAYLRQLPIDTIKIDRAFISDIPDDPTAAKIASAIIALAKDLGLRVVAEGVETQRQVEFLLDRGLFCGQGNLFSLPASADGLVDLFARRRLKNSRQAARKSQARRRGAQTRAVGRVEL